MPRWKLCISCGHEVHGQTESEATKALEEHFVEKHDGTGGSRRKPTKSEPGPTMFDLSQYEQTKHS